MFGQELDSEVDIKGEHQNGLHVPDLFDQCNGLMHLFLVLFQSPTPFKGSPLDTLVVLFGLLVDFRVVVWIQFGDASADLLEVTRHLIVELLMFVSVSRRDVVDFAHVVGKIKQHRNVGTIVKVQ